MTEPEYRFVKGEGWVASYAPVIYRVKPDDVRVGDVIINWSYRGRVSLNTTRYTVTSVTDRTIIARKPNFSHHIDGTVDWIEVER